VSGYDVAGDFVEVMKFIFYDSFGYSLSPNKYL